MAIITLPPAARIRRVEWTVDQPAQVNRSRWTQRRQVVTQPGPALITATAQLVVAIGEAGMLAIEAFLVDLEGPVNRFRLRASENDQMPLGSVAYVDGNGQSGRSLRLKGGPPGATLRRGMKFGSYDQLLFVMADATFDGAGKATVTFKPSLRLSPADASYVEIVRPTVLMALAGSEVGWSVDPGQTYQAKTLSLEEAIGG